jgi:hypothetical protein
MQTTLTSLSNPRWSNEEHTAIDCLITTSQFGNEILPFTASQNDVEEHGKQLFKDISEGKYGEIAKYIAPAVVIEPYKEQTAQITAK